MSFQFYKEINFCNEEWINYQTGKIFQIKKSREFLLENEISAILCQAGVTIEEFINF